MVKRKFVFAETTLFVFVLVAASSLVAPLPIHQETPVKAVPGVAAGEVNEALQHQLKVLSWRVERERSARVAACRRAEQTVLRALRPLEHPGAPAAVARRQAAQKLDKELAKLQNEWTLFVARSGLVKFPDDPAQYSRALQRHREKQREVRRQLEERVACVEREALAQLALHRPWRCVDADFAEFPNTDLAKALTGKAVEVGTIRYPRADQGPDQDTIFVTPMQLTKLRELVAELQSDEVKLDLKPLDTTLCAA